MNQKFVDGFVKQAEAEGFSREYAYALAKEAGFWSGVGNFANDMFVKPATGIFRDGGRTITALGNGDFGGAAKAFGSTLGNTAITAMNFLPAGGLGSMAVRGALKGGAMAARGLGTMAGRAAIKGVGAAAAAPLKNTAGQLLLTNGARSMAPAAVRPGLNAFANRAMGAAGKLEGWAGGADRLRQAGAQKAMGLLDRGAGKMQQLGRDASEAYQRVAHGPQISGMTPARAPINQNAVSGFMNRNTGIPGTNPEAWTSGQRWMARAQKTVPSSVGMMGYAGNAGQRAEQEQQNQINPYGTYDDYLY